MRRGGQQVIPRPDDWQPGQPAPWAEVAAAQRRPDVDQVRRALAGAAGPKPWAGSVVGGRAASGVLAALYDHRGLAEVILTRRSENLRAHRGEVSFPGGRQEAGDQTLTATALREAHEEVGLDPASVEIVGELDHLATFSSGAHIVPYVGVVAAKPELVAQASEVSHILHVPLAELLDPSIYREEFWRFPDGVLRAITFFELEGDTVWGATARMLRQLLANVVGVDPDQAIPPGSHIP